MPTQSAVTSQSLRWDLAADGMAEGPGISGEAGRKAVESPEA
jgi:hypothetical protein